MTEKEIQEDIVSRLHKALIEDDYCPVCLGELDEGWECNRCGYDCFDDVD